MLKTNWQIISEKDCTFTEKCYMKCGSFCCSYKTITKHTNFIINLTTLYLTVDEYNYLNKSGKLQLGLNYHPVQFNISDNIKFTIIDAKCTFNGFCPLHKYRPFLCKLYPFKPIIDYKGIISGYAKGNTWQEKLFDEHPCAYDFGRFSVPENIQLIVKEFFKDPKNIFYFKSLEILNQFIEEKIIELKNDPSYGNFENLVKIVEFLYLKRKLIDTLKIKTSIMNLYTLMKNYYKGDFILDKVNK